MRLKNSAKIGHLGELPRWPYVTFDGTGRVWDVRAVESQRHLILKIVNMLYPRVYYCSVSEQFNLLCQNTNLFLFTSYMLLKAWDCCKVHSLYQKLDSTIRDRIQWWNNTTKKKTEKWINSFGKNSFHQVLRVCWYIRATLFVGLICCRYWSYVIFGTEI